VNRTLKTIGAIFGAAGLLAGLLLCNFYVSFGYGGWTGFFAELRSLPGEEKLAALRSEAIDELTQAQVELGSVPGLTLSEKTFSDMCAKGEHSWKRSESYAYVCAYRLTYYYGLTRDYKEILLDLEQTLGNLGWSIGEQTPRQPTISEALREYSGEIFLVELPYYRKPVSTGRALVLALNGFYGNSSYWTKSSSEPDPFGFGIGIGQKIYKNASSQSPQTIFQRIIAAGQEAIMIAISKEYFRN
jgi:hypothetical protein